MTREIEIKKSKKNKGQEVMQNKQKHRMEKLEEKAKESCKKQ